MPERADLPDGQVIDLSSFRGRWPESPWSAFPAQAGPRRLRAYLVGPGHARRLGAGLKARASLSVPALPPVWVQPLGRGLLVVAERGKALALPEGVLEACRLLAGVMGQLHEAGLLWLRLGPDALEDGPRIANLDLGACAPGAVPADWPREPAYSAPELCLLDGPRIGPATDVYALALFAYYALAGLPGGFPGRGPEAFAFQYPPLRAYNPHLPPGLEPVVRRALGHEPRSRQPTPGAFVDELAGAFEAARRREAWSGAVRLEAEAATREGLLHRLAGLPNQDSHAVAVVEGGLAAVVCDGVTRSLIGSGELASRAAVGQLAASLPGLVGVASLEERAGLITEAFLQAGRAILRESMALPLGPSVTDPVDLMSTTAVAGIFSGRELLLASTGDSRAYLVRDGAAEQLTMDGDVRCLQLAGGVPPEEVAELGSAALALYHCLGIGERGPGGLVHDDERGRPFLWHYHMLPGDVVVLCSDGLVEEGVFLGPRDLAALVSAHEGPGLAEALVEAACLMHRAPTDGADGSGDDVTCVVVRVLQGAKTDSPPAAPPARSR